MLASFSTAVEPTTARTSRVPTKPHRFRSLTGCLTCRQRKKKCDERKPICVACTRNSLRCAWPAAGSRRNTQNSVVRAASQACALTETSSLLFTHYVAETAHVLSTFSPDGNNPFVTLLVPLCYKDDLLMHSLLALSGAHMKSKSPGIDVYLATYRHYSIVIRTIRESICAPTALDVPQALRMLLALLIISFFETLTGDDPGAMFSHLRASRQIFLRLANGPLASSTDENGRLFSFVLEIYRYFILSNNIIPHGSINCQTLPQDPFLDDILGKMSHFDTCGVIFGDSHGLFEILPCIAVLAARRLTEQNASQTSLDMHRALHVRITEWKPPESAVHNQEWQAQREPALGLCREATLLYLETAMTPDPLNHCLALTKIQNHIDKIVLYAKQAGGSPYETIFLGPLMIAGSCMLQTDQRQLLLASLRSNRFHMNHCLRAASLLEQLWDDHSGRIFGPSGLAIIMRRRGINLGIA